MKILILEREREVHFLPENEEEKKELLQLGLAVAEARDNRMETLRLETPVRELTNECHMTELLHLDFKFYPINRIR